MDKLSDRVSNGEFHSVCSGTTDTLAAEIAALEQQLAQCRLDIDSTGITYLGNHIPWAELNKLNPTYAALEQRLEADKSCDLTCS